MAVTRPAPARPPATAPAAPGDNVLGFSKHPDCRGCRHFGPQRGSCLQIRLSRSAWVQHVTAPSPRPACQAAIDGFVERAKESAQAAYAYRVGDLDRCPVRQDRRLAPTSAEPVVCDEALLASLIDDPFSGDDLAALGVEDAALPGGPHD